MSGLIRAPRGIARRQRAFPYQPRELHHKLWASKGYVVRLPADLFPADRYLDAAVDSATCFDRPYAGPGTSDGGLLYYRKDLLDKYDLQPPTWDEMEAACQKIKTARTTPSSTAAGGAEQGATGQQGPP